LGLVAAIGNSGVEIGTIALVDTVIIVTEKILF
jgi:hypothetical protein